jgi:hypothetical protein
MALRMTPEAVDLLFQVIETPEARLSGAAAALCEERVQPLRENGLLRAHGHADVAVLPHDDEDRPVPLFSWGEAGEMAGFDPTCGPVVVPGEQLVNWAADLPHLIKLMVAELDLLTAAAPHTLVPQLLWEVGDARIGRRRERVSVWFCRRLWDPEVLREVRQMAVVRPHPRQRLLLTSSRPARVRDVVIAAHLVVPVQEVLRFADSPMISSEILDARIAGVPPVAASEAVWLSPDGKKLVINGTETFTFRSKPHIAAINALVAAHRQGRRIRTLDLTDLGSLRRMFGEARWSGLSRYLINRDGGWSIET